MAAVDKIEEKRKPEDFIGHRNRGAMGALPIGYNFAGGRIATGPLAPRNDTETWEVNKINKKSTG